MQVFRDKVAIVTGAASGIGLEMVKQLSRAGAIVVAADIDSDRLEQECGFIPESGGRIETRLADVAELESLQFLVEETVKAHGTIDYQFNNAGIGGTGGEVRDLAPVDWERIVRINLLSVVHGSSLAYAHMRARGNGHIVNMASAAGLLGAPQMVPYATTKAAVVAFSRDLRIEAATFGVKVTVLCPGYVESRIFENVSSNCVNVREVKNLVPFRFLPVEQAVSAMLRGVARNKPIVALPSYVRILWLLRRLFPTFTDEILGRKALNDFRKARLPDS